MAYSGPVQGISAGRPLVMGVLNVTPDSFSDGGRWASTEAAVARGLALAGAGADVVDVGGESSRPGATPVPEPIELARVVPVVEALAPVVRVSVDTVKPAVARAAVAAGASLVNDISGSLWPVAAELGVGWVAMHMRGTPADMQDDPCYDDVVAEVSAFLLERLDRAVRAGVGEVWVDPGFGFGKTDRHNLALLARLGELVAAAAAGGARGVVAGTSRKRTLGALGRPAPAPVLAVGERDEASLAAAVWVMAQGAGMVRVHEVEAAAQAALLMAA